jgi:hypothetical protein
VFDYGIERYRPVWSSGLGGVVRDHAPRLRGLVGRTLTRVWLVWDPADDTWFGDCPVVLDFAGERVEIQHREFDDISVTWNTIDPGAPVRWPGFGLEWRAEPLPGLRALRGLPLTGVDLLEWAGGDVADGNVDVSFVLGPERVTVFNALDENGLTFGPPDARQRCHVLRRGPSHGGRAG